MSEMTEPDDVTASRAWEPGLRSIREPGVPLFMNVTLTINPERLDQFLAALRDVLPAARAEPTCIYLHAGQSVTESNVFILSEGWRDLVEYRDVILHKPYFQAYLQISESTYAKPRVTQPLIPGPDGFLTNALPGAHRIHREMVTSAHPGESEHQ